MRIKAKGARRRVYEHEVVDDSIDQISITSKGNIYFQVESEESPGLGSGLYLLDIYLSKDEVISLYNKAIKSEEHLAIRELKKKVRKLERALDKQD